MNTMVIHILISLLSLFVIILILHWPHRYQFGNENESCLVCLYMCLWATVLIQFCQICVCMHQHIVLLSLISHFLDYSNEDLSSTEDSSRLVFIWKVGFKWAVFLVVYGVPVSWCRVVSKTIGIIVRLAGRNEGVGIGVPNVPWHVWWRAG